MELQSEGVALASALSRFVSGKSGNPAGNSGECSDFLRNAAVAPEVDFLGVFPEMLGGVSPA